MDCNEYRENVTNLIENSLTTREKKSALEHQETCSDCSQLTADVQKILKSFGNIGVVSTSPDFETKLYKKLREGSDVSISDKVGELLNPASFGFKAFAMGFAVLLILVTGTVYMYDGSSGDAGNGMPALSSPGFIEKKSDKPAAAEEDELIESDSEEKDDANSTPDNTDSFKDESLDE